MYMQGRLPRHTVATGYYGEELKSTSAMYFAEKLRINSLFPDGCKSLEHRVDEYARKYF